MELTQIPLSQWFGDRLEGDRPLTKEELACVVKQIATLEQQTRTEQIYTATYAAICAVDNDILTEDEAAGCLHLTVGKWRKLREETLKWLTPHCFRMVYYCDDCGAEKPMEDLHALRTKTNTHICKTCISRQHEQPQEK